MDDLYARIYYVFVHVFSYIYTCIYNNELTMRI